MLPSEVKYYCMTIPSLDITQVGGMTSSFFSVSRLTLVLYMIAEVCLLALTSMSVLISSLPGGRFSPLEWRSGWDNYPNKLGVDILFQALA